MEINELYKIIEKENGSSILALSVVVLDENQNDVRVWQASDSGDLHSFKVLP